jgi:ribonuclease PH
MERIDGRALDQLRQVDMIPGFTKFAEGSCLISCGDTMVLCNASVEEKVPGHVTSGGWITAEYSMLPKANRERSRRDVSKLKLSPRSAEIQRLIGRSLRSAVDLEKLEGISITVDCDVLQGDGGTRTASVTGSFVALVLCFRKLLKQGKISEMPVKTFVSGVSAGIVGGVPMLDLQYSEDSKADVDLNCVMDGNGGIIELQGTGEGRPFTLEEQQKLLELCQKGNRELQEKQQAILGDLT